MQVRFDKTTRKRLRQSLKANGCANASRKYIDLVERLVQSHFGRWMSQIYESALYSAAHATIVNEHSDRICRILECPPPALKRRLMRELEERDSGRSLDSYDSAVNDLCIAAEYARERSLKVALEADDGLDKDLRQLCIAVCQAWTSLTLESVPNPTNGLYKLGWYDLWHTPWQDAQTLQHHPLWIVLDAIGIKMPESLFIDLMEAISCDGTLWEKPSFHKE